MRWPRTVRMRLALLTGTVVLIGYLAVAFLVLWLLTDVVVQAVTVSVPIDPTTPAGGGEWTPVQPTTGATGTAAIKLRSVLSGWGTVAVVATAPLAGLLTGFIAWLVAGRVLRPVGVIEQRFRELTAGELSLRVPEPAGDDEVARLARTLNDTLGRLQAASERQLRFVADAAHELRGPIGAVRADLEVAATYPDRVDPAEAVREALVDVERLQQVVVDLLALARLEAGETPRREILPFFEVMAEVRPPVDVDFSTEGDMATLIVGSRGQLSRMTQNLLDNAARHARSAVVLRVGQFDGAVVLRVDDDGPGIPVDQRDQVFVPFHRLDDARSRDDGGSGLGLAIVAETVRAHGGTVRVDTAPSGGTRLRVELPAVDQMR